MYKKIEEGADINFVFGHAYKCPEGYTPLMVACHRGRCVQTLLLAAWACMAGIEVALPFGEQRLDSYLMCLQLQARVRQGAAAGRG